MLSTNRPGKANLDLSIYRSVQSQNQTQNQKFFRAPADCNMYHTGIGGTIQSYNWQGGEQIHGSKWTTCIRREDGYCYIGYKVVEGQTIDTFQVDDISTTAAMVVSMIKVP